MKKQALFLLVLMPITSNLAGMAAGEQWMRKILKNFLGENAKACKGSDYDYSAEIALNASDAQRGRSFLHIQERCRAGVVQGAVSEFRFGTDSNPVPLEDTLVDHKPYVGMMGSTFLQNQMHEIDAANCPQLQKVFSPAGMCICLDAGRRLLVERLERMKK